MKPERYPDFRCFDLAAERQKREQAERRAREWLQGAWQILATLLAGVGAVFIGLALAVASWWYFVLLAQKLGG